MVDKCECGHYEPSHQFQHKYCNICPCAKFVKVEPEPDPEPKPVTLRNSECTCGHYASEHRSQGRCCDICSCARFVDFEPQPETETQPYIQMSPDKRRYFDPKPFQETAEYPPPVDRDIVIPVLDSIAKTLRESGYQEASDYVSGYRDTIETQPAVTREPLSLPEAGGVVLVLDMLSRSHECWCAAGSSDLIPDHNEICVKVRALYESMGRKEGKKRD